MAYPKLRSCRNDLYEGATDGSVWKPAPNRGGDVQSPSNQHQVTLECPREPVRGLFADKGEC